MEEPTTSKVEILAAFVTGALAGVVLGLLFAPEKGTVTRSKLLTGVKDLAQDVKIKLKKEAEALRAKATELELLAESELEEVTEKIHDDKTV